MYPAIKAKMGLWTYYIVKLKVSDLAKEVSLSSDVHQDRTLDEAIQREIHNSRARQNLVVYLHDREDRFLNSIVVAALGGSPTFTPLQLADTPENSIFRAMQVDQSFGVLTFAGGQKYYALDGQHRLAAIRAILETSSNSYDDFAREYVTEEFKQRFRDEEISVIMVVQDPGDDPDVRSEVLKDYRRLFSSLNRYAKPTDESTNIIMDEDDGIAILTRRLIAEHEFFKWTVEKPSDYSIIKTTKGKNLRSVDSYFSQIEVFYGMNLMFLKSGARVNKGWKSSKGETIPDSQFKFWKLNRPDDEIIEEYYQELANIWTGILATMPELNNPPSTMRQHNTLDDEETSDSYDHVVFWPIGQELFAQVARELLDVHSSGAQKDVLDGKEVLEALKPLKHVNWALHEAPWRHLLLVQTHDRSGNLVWTMRNEGRTAAVKMGREVLDYIVGVTQLDDEGEAALKRRWTAELVPVPSDEVAEVMWKNIVEQAISD